MTRPRGASCRQAPSSIPAAAAASYPPRPVPVTSCQVKGGSARLHWLFMPDSYDEWVPAAAAPGAAEPPRRPPRGPWHVYARWLTDSERYNEWMNPGDYETPQAAEEAKRKREAGEEGEDAGRKVGAGCAAGGAAGWWVCGWWCWRVCSS